MLQNKLISLQHGHLEYRMINTLQTEQNVIVTVKLKKTVLHRNK